MSGRGTRALAAVAGATRHFRCPACHRGVRHRTRRCRPPRGGRSSPAIPSGRRPETANGGRGWFAGHRQRPSEPPPALVRTVPSGGWTGPPRRVDLADKRERCRILVGRGKRRQAAPFPPLPHPSARRRERDPSPQGATRHDRRARDQTENSRPDLPHPERGLPPPRGEARPEAPFRVQGAPPTTRGRPAASPGGRIPGRQPRAPAEAPPARAGGDQTSRPGPRARRSQSLGGLARHASRSNRRAPRNPGHARARATGRVLRWLLDGRAMAERTAGTGGGGRRGRRPRLRRSDALPPRAPVPRATAVGVAALSGLARHPARPPALRARMGGSRHPHQVDGGHPAREGARTHRLVPGADRGPLRLPSRAVRRGTALPRDRPGTLARTGRGAARADQFGATAPHLSGSQLRGIRTDSSPSSLARRGA